jgi:hypothetical protein
MGNDNSLVTLVITYISFYSIQKLDCSLSIYLSIYNFISNVRVLRLVGLLLPAYPLERHFTSTVQAFYCRSAVLREAQKRVRAKIEIL